MRKSNGSMTSPVHYPMLPLCLSLSFSHTHTHTLLTFSYKSNQSRSSHCAHVVLTGPSQLFYALPVLLPCRVASEQEQKGSELLHQWRETLRYSQASTRCGGWGKLREKEEGGVDTRAHPASSFLHQIHSSLHSVQEEGLQQGIPGKELIDCNCVPSPMFIDYHSVPQHSQH